MELFPNIKCKVRFDRLWTIALGGSACPLLPGCAAMAAAATHRIAGVHGEFWRAGLAWARKQKKIELHLYVGMHPPLRMPLLTRTFQSSRRLPKPFFREPPSTQVRVVPHDSIVRAWVSQRCCHLGSESRCRVLRQTWVVG